MSEWAIRANHKKLGCHREARDPSVTAELLVVCTAIRSLHSACAYTQNRPWLLPSSYLLIVEVISDGKEINPLIDTGNYSATSNNIKLVHWPLMGGLLHLVQRGGDWAGPQPAHPGPPRCTKCNTPPINGQCINHRTAVGILLCPLKS